jgi:hypothetical protein
MTSFIHCARFLGGLGRETTPSLIDERELHLPAFAGLVTLVRGPIAENAAFREQNERSALWPTRRKRIP